MGKEQKEKIIKILIGTGIVLAVLYLIGAFVFRDRFYFRSYINGVNYGGKTVKQVEMKIADDVSKYKLTIKERDKKEETITAADIGLIYVSDGTIQDLKEKQSPLNWLFGSLKKDTQEMEATTTYDRNKLTSVIDNLVCLDEEKVVKPVNAYLNYKDGEYEVVNAVQGNQLDEEKFRALVKDAVESGKTSIDLEKEDCYLKPEYDETKKELLEAQKVMNQYVKTEITYDFSDRTEVLNGDIIKDWLSIDDNFNVIISEEGQVEYIKGLEQKYNTLGQPRQFVTHDKKTIIVPSGNYGYMINRWEEKDEMEQNIKDGAKIKREPVYRYRGYVREENDIGDTYVEIDLTQQKMWFYVNGKTYVETDVVTGNVSQGNDTPVGVYAITYKERDATLTGENYSSPVEYWMPFNGNIGIHDASWRTDFGGELYKTRGSHGCVNTPPANAKKIFEKIEKGMPVIVHN